MDQTVGARIQRIARERKLLKGKKLAEEAFGVSCRRPTKGDTYLLTQSCGHKFRLRPKCRLCIISPSAHPQQPQTGEAEMAYAGGKAKIRYVVQCQRHGKESDKWDGKQVAMPRPRNKRERNVKGCPECAAEKRAA